MQGLHGTEIYFNCQSNCESIYVKTVFEEESPLPYFLIIHAAENLEIVGQIVNQGNNKKGANYQRLGNPTGWCSFFPDCIPDAHREGSIRWETAYSINEKAPRSRKGLTMSPVIADHLNGIASFQDVLMKYNFI